MSIIITSPIFFSHLKDQWAALAGRVLVHSRRIPSPRSAALIHIQMIVHSKDRALVQDEHVPRGDHCNDLGLAAAGVYLEPAPQWNVEVRIDPRSHVHEQVELD